MEIKAWFREHGATLLSWGATLGTVAGSVLAAKAVLNVKERIDTAREEKGEDLTLWEKVKVGASSFVPCAVVEAATIECIHGSNAMNKATIARVNEVAVTTAAALSAYAQSVGKITDPTTEYAAYKRVEMKTMSELNGDPPWDEKRLFYIDGYPEFFERTMEQVFKAEYELNRLFVGRGYATLNELYCLLDLPKVDEGDDIGWHDYIGEVYFGYVWIDFEHPPFFTADGMLVTEIRMPFEPHPLTEEEVERELDEAIGRPR